MQPDPPIGSEARTARPDPSRRRPFGRRVIGAAVLDASVYAEIEHHPAALAQAALVVALAGVARGLVALATGDPFGVTASLVIAFASWGIVTALLWLVGVVFDHDSSTFLELLRTVGFAASPLLLLVLGALPLLSAAAPLLVLKALLHVAAAVALVVAAREALDVSTLRAIVICGSVLAVLALVLAYVINAVALRLQGVIDVVVSAAAQT
jgi:hypothetical protein